MRRAIWTALRTAWGPLENVGDIPRADARGNTTVRFDDSLKTVLSADASTDLGARSAWRQLVDLVSRGRVAADAPTLARLRELRIIVPLEVRAASGRSLAFATPSAALVELFAEDEIAVAAPVLRTAVLAASDWSAILPRLTPRSRSILRHRRDLPSKVVRALESFGATDFVLADNSPREPSAPADARDAVEPVPAPAPDTPRSATPFVSLGDVARGLPMVAEAMRRSEAAAPEAGTFEIVDIVARIDAFRAAREADPHGGPPKLGTGLPQSFRYETDRDGVLRWIDGVPRGALVGASIAVTTPQGSVCCDAVAGGALRKRTRFMGARIDVGGHSDAAGAWRFSGEPMFDHASGRFVGMRGIARRAGASGEMAMSRDADSLRQLVHELRTPTNAISGFAELIEAEILGPVAVPYRDHAATIRREAMGLIAAIDDLDTAARIDGKALEPRPTVVALEALLERVVQDLAGLADARGAHVAVADLRDAAARVDDRLAERLISRLLGALLSASSPGETIEVARGADAGGTVTLEISRPRAFAGRDASSLMRIDADLDDETAGASLLGIGFALRLAGKLAGEIGGALTFGADRLTLRLPAAVTDEVGRAIN